MTAAGLSDRNAQLGINVGLSAWFFLTGLVGTVIVDKFRRRTLFSIPPDSETDSIDISNGCMIPLLVLLGVMTDCST